MSDDRARRDGRSRTSGGSAAPGLTPRRCPDCSAEVPAGFTFCGHCGRSLEEQQRRAAPSDRRTVTILFADISGFTRLGTQLDPEELRQVLQETFGALIEEVRIRGGWLEKQVGDALVAVFGAPTAHDNDPFLAVDAALAMTRRMALVNRETADRLPEPLQLHIGINTGLVVMGPGIDDPERGDVIVVGDTVNTAARLQGAARPGEILVGESTYAATRDGFDYGSSQPLAVKGKTEKVVAYECLGIAQRRPSTRDIASPLVGRGKELETLVGRIDRLVAGQGGAVTVAGDAGVGKSRLLIEAKRAAPAERVAWLHARAVPFSQATGYWPFVEVIRADAGITYDDGEATSWTKLERRMRRLAASEADELLPYIATLLTLEVGPGFAERVRYLDSDAMGRQVYRSVRRWFELVVQERPACLVLEDWHWADPSSAELLEHLIGLTLTTPLLLWCSCRPDPDTAAARFRATASRACGEQYVEVAVEPLSPAESDELVASLLNVDDVSPRVRGLVLAKAEGNPFFIEEVVRSLVDVGAIVRDSSTGRWQTTPAVELVSIPHTLGGVITARFDRLDEETKETLRVAAVIGRRFLYRVLRALDGSPLLDDRLAFLCDLEVIRENKDAPELEYVFKHAVTQEAIYESILLSRRRELHARVAELFEALFSDRLDEFSSLLAHHYACAEQWQNAENYLLAAGDHAGRLAADAEALEHYRMALAAQTRASGEEWDALRWAALERKMGEALFRSGEHLEGAEYLHRAIGRLGYDLPVSRSGVRSAIPWQLLVQVWHRLAPDAFVSRRSRSDPVANELADMYEVLNWVDFFVDRERFVLDVLLELNLAERTGYRTGIVRASLGFGVLCDTIPLRQLARRYLDRAVALAQESGDPQRLAEAYLRLAMHEHYSVGDWEAALDRYGQAAAWFHDAGDLRRRGAAMALMSGVLRARGELDASLALARQAARVGQDGDDRQVWGWGVGEEGRSLCQSGRLEEAACATSKAIELLESIPDYLSAVSAYGDLARCRLRQGRLDEAMSLGETAHRLLVEQRLRAFLCSPVYLARAESLLAAAEADPSTSGPTLKRAGRASAAAVRQGRLDCEALAAAHRCRGTYQWLRGRPRRAVRSWRRSIAVAERIGARYELALTWLEIGSRTGERGYLEDAEQVFSELGDELDLAHVRERLGESEEPVATPAG